jgi:hypothetical protein
MYVWAPMTWSAPWRFTKRFWHLWAIIAAIWALWAAMQRAALMIPARIYGLRPPFAGAKTAPGNGNMFSLLADNHAQGDLVYTAAMAFGAVSEGPTGARPQYGPNFYAAYLRGPNGNKFNAVCYQPAMLPTE